MIKFLKMELESCNFLKKNLFLFFFYGRNSFKKNDFFFFCLLGLHLWHMEVSSLGVAIPALAVGLCHSHRNAGSLTH